MGAVVSVFEGPQSLDVVRAPYEGVSLQVSEMRG